MSDAAAQMAIEDRIGDLLGGGEPPEVQPEPAPAPAPAPTGEDAPPAVAQETTKPAGGDDKPPVNPAIEGFSAEHLAEAMGIEGEPPVETQVVEEEEVETPASVESDPKASKAWQHLRQTNKAMKAELAELKKQVASTSAAPAEEVESLRKALAEREQELGKYNLAATTEFQQKYDAPMGTVLNRGVSLLVRNGKTQEEAKELMLSIVNKKNLAEVREALYDEPAEIQGPLTLLYSDFADLAEAKNAALTEWKQTQEALGVQAKANQTAKINETVAAGVTAALNKVVKNGNWMYMVPEGNELAQQTVAKRVDAVQGLLKTASAEDIAYWVLEGITAQPARELVVKLNEQLSELKTKTNKVIGAQPEVKGAPAGGGKPAKTAGPRDIASVIDEILDN